MITDARTNFHLLEDVNHNSPGELRTQNRPGECLVLAANGIYENYSVLYFFQSSLIYINTVITKHLACTYNFLAAWYVQVCQGGGTHVALRNGDEHVISYYADGVMINSW